MLRDRLLFGALAGVVANFIMDLLEFPLWKLDAIQYTLGHYAASLFMGAETTHHTLIGSVASFLADNIYSAVLGVIFLYLLLSTGQRFLLVKGLIYGAFLWLFSYGGMRSLSVVQLRNVPTESWDIIIQFLLHRVWSRLGWFTQKYGSALGESKVSWISAFSGY